MLIKEDFRQLNEFQKAELGFLLEGIEGERARKKTKRCGVQSTQR